LYEKGGLSALETRAFATCTPLLTYKQGRRNVPPMIAPLEDNEKVSAGALRTGNFGSSRITGYSKQGVNIRKKSAT